MSNMDKKTSKKTIVFRRVTERELEFDEWFEEMNVKKLTKEKALEVWEKMCEMALEDESLTEVENCDDLENCQIEDALESLVDASEESED